MKAVLFKETDDIIKLGKWAYHSIPLGTRCKHCPILYKPTPRPTLAMEFTNIKSGYGYECRLLNRFLIFDNEGPFKDDSCPRAEVSNER